MATIKDVAREAGVSIATVSYVLNGKAEFVGEDTRARVWDAVRITGYMPNVTARNLRSSQSRLIGYAWHEIKHEEVNFVLDRFIYTLARAAEAAGYHLLTFTYPPDDPLRVYDELIRTGRVDAFVLSGTVRDDPRVRFLIDKHFPFVSFGRANDAWAFDWIDTDGAHGVAQATAYLHELGHERVAIAAWDSGSLAGEYRVQGYFDQLERAGIAPRADYIARVENSEPAGRAALSAWCSLPAHEQPTAVIAVSDLIAIGIMNEAEARGLVVGRDLSVIGFDDAPMTQYLRPALTTIRQPIHEIGAGLIEMLERALISPPNEPQQRLVTPELVKRASCGSPQAHLVVR